MADDSHENGTSNGDVPEIELIIKVSACAPHARPTIFVVEMLGQMAGGARREGGGGSRQVRTEEKDARSCPVLYGRGTTAVSCCSFLRERLTSLSLFPCFNFSRRDEPRDRENRPTRERPVGVARDRAQPRK